MRPWFNLIKLVSWLVPRRLRAEWRREWEAELQHHESLLGRWRRGGWRDGRELLRHSLGSLKDAVLLQPKRLEDEMIQDLRYGWRMMMKSPVFFAMAVLTLALGIGANTTIFTLVDSILFKPMPFKDPERLVMVWRANADRTSKYLPSSVPLFIDWQQQNRVFEQMAAFTTGRFNLAGESEPELVSGANVSAGFFDTLGVKPLLGRGFQPGDDRPGATAVAVLGYGLWQQRFGSAAEIIGQKVTINAQPYTVVGVMPAGFNYPAGMTLWVPLTLDPNANRNAFFASILARIKPGMGIEQAHADMDRVAAQISAQYGQTSRDHFDLILLHEQLTGNLRAPLLVLFGAVGFVLLIGCANVANLLLARAAGREREMAVRSALGAGRLRLLRQLLVESLLLAAFGGGAGLLLAAWSVSWLAGVSALKPAGLNRIALDGQALIFTSLTILLTAAIFGLIPAMQTSLQQPGTVLKGSGVNPTARAGNRRLRGSLVVIEVALSLVLLVGAGLLIKSFLILRAVDPGFNPEGVVMLNLSLPPARYSEQAQRVTFIRQVTQRLRALPVIQAAATAAYAPLSEVYTSRIFIIEGRPEPGPGQGLFAGQIPISPDFFRTLQIPLLRGRDFTDRDNPEAPGAVIVNQSFASRFFPNEEVIGKRIHLGTRRPAVWFEIVGVVGDVRQLQLEKDPPALVYVPHLQNAWSVISLLVRPAGGATIASALKNAVSEVDKDLGVSNLTTLDGVLTDSIGDRRALMALLGILAALALLLAAIGIYGVIAYSVAQRTHEIGIRMTLGAQADDVLKLVVGQGMKLVLIGIVIGMIASFALTRWIKTLLFNVSATDPVTFGLISLLLILVALLACYLPARRATRVDPLVAIRYE